MVEFALALPVILLLIFGVLEAGRLVFIYSSVVNASREAARFGSAFGIDSDGNLNYQNCAGIRAAARKVTFLTTLQDSDITIQYDHGPTIPSPAPAPPPPPPVPFHTCTGSVDHGVAVVANDRVVVTITTSYSPMVQLVPFTPKPLSVTTARTIIGVVSIAP